MKFSNLLFSISFLLLFCCNTNNNTDSNEITINQTKLKILNDSIEIGDSIILEFSSKDDIFFFIKSNLLNKTYHSESYNSLDIIFINEEYEILNDMKITESDIYSNVLNVKNIDCEINTPIEFISDSIIKIKGLNHNDLINNSGGKIFCYIEYISDINRVMKCASNDYNRRLINGKIKAFTGSLKSNLVLLKP